MPFHFSRPEQAQRLWDLYGQRGLYRILSEILDVDQYASKLASNTLTAKERQLGFKTFVLQDQACPRLYPEDDYIASFHSYRSRIAPSDPDFQAALPEASIWASFIGSAPKQHWPSTSWVARLKGPSTPTKAAHPGVPITPTRPRYQQHVSFENASPNMATPNRRPSVRINGLAAVQEDDTGSASAAPTMPPFLHRHTISGSSAASFANATPVPPPDAAAAATTSPSRDAAKLNMLRRMRPPPFQYAWTFYHDRHSEAGNSYEGRLTLMLENIISIKPFWEAHNLFPLRNLRMKDAVHFFKRGVRPVWEDPRNVHGGSWTFRVQKYKSEAMWRELLLLAVGEQFADVIQPKDDLCGLSFSVRFNSNLISIWNRDGKAHASIDGILNTVMAKIAPELRPREGNYYYKRHSEHAGYAEALAKAKSEADAKAKADADKKAAQAEAGDVKDEDEIEEAKVTEGEVQRVEAEEDQRELEELEKSGMAPVT